MSVAIILAEILVFKITEELICSGLSWSSCWYEMYCLFSCSYKGKYIIWWITPTRVNNNPLYNPLLIPSSLYINYNVYHKFLYLFVWTFSKIWVYIRSLAIQKGFNIISEIIPAYKLDINSTFNLSFYLYFIVYI